MILKLIIGLVASAMALTFYAIPIIKLKEPALVVVVLVAVILMFIKLYEDIRRKDD